MEIKNIVIKYVKKIINEDKRNVFNLLYYSVIEALLVLSIPLASAIVINSVLAHASLSILVLGLIVLVLFLFITVLQVFKEYIVEKFQQKVFIKKGIEVAVKILKIKKEDTLCEEKHRKIMNYFFDILGVQKFFPILLLDGVGIIIKIIVSLLLLLAFDPMLFISGGIFFVTYIVVLVYLGRGAVGGSVKRSNEKHSTIYFLQNIDKEEGTVEEVLSEFDVHLNKYVESRQRMFNIIIKQLGFTFFAEGFIFSMFLIIGGHLVISGSLPLGEFVAAEIIVASIIYTLKGFAKKLDHVYDMIEGFYKLNQLSVSIKGKDNG